MAVGEDLNDSGGTRGGGGTGMRREPRPQHAGGVDLDDSRVGGVDLNGGGSGRGTDMEAASTALRCTRRRSGR
jgi:hypothetical protein